MFFHLLIALCFNLRKMSQLCMRLYLELFSYCRKLLFMLSYIMLVLIVRLGSDYDISSMLNVEMPSHWVGNSKYYIDKTVETTKYWVEYCKLIFPWITENVDSDDLKPPPWTYSWDQRGFRDPSVHPKISSVENSLVVQWLECHASIAGVQVWSWLGN